MIHYLLLFIDDLLIGVKDLTKIMQEVGQRFARRHVPILVVNLVPVFLQEGNYQYNQTIGVEPSLERRIEVPYG